FLSDYLIEKSSFSSVFPANLLRFRNSYFPVLFTFRDQFFSFLFLEPSFLQDSYISAGSFRNCHILLSQLQGRKTCDQGFICDLASKESVQYYKHSVICNISCNQVISFHHMLI